MSITGGHGHITSHTGKYTFEILQSYSKLRLAPYCLNEIYLSLYNNQINALALIRQSATAYCAGKVNQLIYYIKAMHHKFLWFKGRYTTWDAGGTLEEFANHEPQSIQEILPLFSCSTNIPRGLSASKPAKLVVYCLNIQCIEIRTLISIPAGEINKK